MGLRTALGVMENRTPFLLAELRIPAYSLRHFTE